MQELTWIVATIVLFLVAIDAFRLVVKNKSNNVTSARWCTISALIFCLMFISLNMIRYTHNVSDYKLSGNSNIDCKVIYPGSQKVLSLDIGKNQIKYSNGTLIDKCIVLEQSSLKHYPDSKMPRGTMVKVQHISNWQNLKNCFSSQPRNYIEEDLQVWFSEENTHDLGALNSQEQSAMNLIPFYSSFKKQTQNRVLNMNDTVAKDRGSSYVVINSTNYDGDDFVRIEILEEQWVTNYFWNNFYYSVLFLSLLAITVGYIQQPQIKRVVDESLKKSDWRQFTHMIIEIVYNLYYVIHFPHFSVLITLGLWLTIFLPLVLIACLFVPEQFFGGLDGKSPHYSMLKRITDVVLQYFGINCQELNNVQRQLYIFAVIACTGNLSQMSLKLYDSLLIGNTFTAYQGFIVFLDFFGFNYRMGKLTGINEQHDNKFPLFWVNNNDDHYVNDDARASNFGFHTVLTLSQPLFASFMILNLSMWSFFVNSYSILDQFSTQKDQKVKKLSNIYYWILLLVILLIAVIINNHKNFMKTKKQKAQDDLLEDISDLRKELIKLGQGAEVQADLNKLKENWKYISAEPISMYKGLSIEDDIQLNKDKYNQLDPQFLSTRNVQTKEIDYKDYFHQDPKKAEQVEKELNDLYNNQNKDDLEEMDFQQQPQNQLEQTTEEKLKEEELRQEIMGSYVDPYAK